MKLTWLKQLAHKGLYTDFCVPFIFNSHLSVKTKLLHLFTPGTVSPQPGAIEQGTPPFASAVRDVNTGLWLHFLLCTLRQVTPRPCDSDFME